MYLIFFCANFHRQNVVVDISFEKLLTFVLSVGKILFTSFSGDIRKHKAWRSSLAP